MFTAVHNVVAGIVLLPFVVVGFHLPTQPSTWIFFVLMTLFAFLSDWYAFRALVHLDVSVYQIVDQFRQPLLVLFGLSLLGESVTAFKLIGIVLVSGGVALAVYDRARARHHAGLKTAIWSMFFAAIAVVFVKYAVVDFSEVAMASFELLAIGFLCLIVGRGDVGRAITELKTNRWGLVAAGALFGGSEAFDFMALKLGEASRVVPVFQSSVVFTVLGGALLLGERQRLVQKIIGAGMVVLGVVALKI